MRNENLLLFNRRLELRERLNINPAIIDILRCRKCDIRILLVTDSFLYFSDENFGLSDFVNILETTVHASANLIVSRAHRGDPGNERLNGADKDFIFSDGSLSNIDVVFMFAAGRGSPLLSPPELKALATFMDSGGGVFATGDHDWLGRAMCGDLIRVRSMRKWFYPSAGPFGEPVAPDGNNAERHDTNRPGSDGSFSFNDQSDDIPQTISPVYENVSIFAKEPHPILCGNNGVLKYLPDHPHEGECIVPWEVDRIFTYDSEDFEEYRVDVNGMRPLPKVIATATMLPGAETSTKPPIAGGTFGVMSAYDGHLVEVGRVHCDATWHHFININLTGDDGVSAADPKSMGFLASASGEAYFEDIKNYFRNIATWLAPIEKQRCMRNRWLWNIIRQPSFNEDFGVQLLKSKKLTIRESAELGRHILAYPSLNLSKCQVRRWLLDLMIPELIIEMPDIACLLDPCIPNPNPGPDPLPFIDQEVLLEAAIGDLAVSMFAESSKLEETKSLKGPDTKKLDKMANSSGKSVLKLMGKELGLASKKFSKVASQLKGL